ncbi:MAG: glycosyltransferase family 9 protein [Candidatus Competibacterales bacterium]
MPSSDPIVIIKTAALGDVLRTTSIVPGLVLQGPHPIVWVTATGAVPLLRHHPLIDVVETVDPRDVAGVTDLGRRLGALRPHWVLSFDDEAPLCGLASALPCQRLSGAHLTAAGERGYTADVAPWFDMGLLSVHGKAAADRLKVVNTRSHPAIYAQMLGLPMGRPRLDLPPAALAFGAAFFQRHLGDRQPVIGLNTGAGGRWPTKGLPVERVVALMARLQKELPASTAFLLLGGPEETERHRQIREGVAGSSLEASVVDGGNDNPLLDFAAMVDRCDLLITSDSLALHLAIARRVPLVAFFAPTSAAEIETYGLGAKVQSTAPDYCSYRKDADNSTLTAERLAAATLSVWERHRP